MMAYKMVNTLDSMIGYKDERYRQFGCMAARLDDVLNYIPARLTALFMALVAYRPGLFRFIFRYCHQMPARIPVIPRLLLPVFWIAVSEVRTIISVKKLEALHW